MDVVVMGSDSIVLNLDSENGPALMKIRRLFLLAIIPSVLTLVEIGTSQGEEAKKEKTRTVKANALSLTVPESWKEISVKNSKFRAAQLEIPAAKGDTEPASLIVYYFDGGGGSVGANIQRWVGQFQSKGRKVKITKGDSSNGQYIVVDATGTYNKPVGPPIRRKSKPMPGARMLAVILAVETKGNFFLKLTGPQKSVTAVADSFRTSFGGNTKSEKELKTEE